MNRDEVLAILRAHGAEIQSFGVASMALFGSFARDQAQPDSDVDLLVEFAPDVPVTFDQYFELKEYLEDLLGREMELVLRHRLKARLRPIIEQEAIRVA